MKYNHYLVNILPDKRWKCVCCEKTFNKSYNKYEHQQTPKHILEYTIHIRNKIARIKKEIEAERNE
jgi:hypothetical protein